MSQYFLKREAVPEDVGRLELLIDNAFERVEADVGKGTVVHDFSGAGPASGATVVLPAGKKATEIIGVFANDVSADATGNSKWRPASLFTLADDGLTITNEAVDYNAVGDTFVVLVKPALANPE
jgi:hypothetical protein